MKVSIITICYNSGKTLEDTLKSIAGQTYGDIEYIIIDGASKDNTLSIINKHRSTVNILISEPDEGIYDAMNKGIKRATGDIIGILNSDDVYFDKDAVKNVVDSFIVTGADAVFGDLHYVKANDINSVVRFWKASPYKLNAFSKGWHPPHPTFFVKRNVYDNYGVFDVSFDVSADFELMLRFIGKHQIKTHYLPLVLVKMRTGGESNKSIKNIITGNRNIARAFKKNNLSYPVYYPIARLLPKLLQFVKR